MGMMSLSSEFQAIRSCIELRADFGMQWCSPRKMFYCFATFALIDSVFATTSRIVVAREKGKADDARHQRGLSCFFSIENVISLRSAILKNCLKSSSLDEHFFLPSSWWGKERPDISTVSTSFDDDVFPRATVEWILTASKPVINTALQWMIDHWCYSDDPSR